MNNSWNAVLISLLKNFLKSRPWAFARTSDAGHFYTRVRVVYEGAVEGAVLWCRMFILWRGMIVTPSSLLTSRICRSLYLHSFFSLPISCINPISFSLSFSTSLISTFSFHCERVIYSRFTIHNLPWGQNFTSPCVTCHYDHSSWDIYDKICRTFRPWQSTDLPLSTFIYIYTTNASRTLHKITIKT